MNALLIANALLLTFLYVVWSKSGLVNMAVKTCLFILAIANAFQAYQLLK